MTAMRTAEALHPRLELFERERAVTVGVELLEVLLCHRVVCLLALGIVELAVLVRVELREHLRVVRFAVLFAHRRTRRGAVLGEREAGSEAEGREGDGERCDLEVLLHGCSSLMKQGKSNARANALSLRDQRDGANAAADSASDRCEN